eukprot:symbB.v1.2.004031.t3/scaffold227.1/size261201/17
MQRQGERPTVSRTPGTTLGLIQLRAFRRSAISPVFASLYDTPGVHQPNSMQNLLPIDEYNYVQPTRHFAVHTVTPAKDVLAQLKASDEAVSHESLQRWLGRSVRYLWGFPNQKPVLAVEVYPPISAMLKLSFVGVHNLAITCQANVPGAGEDGRGYPEAPEGMDLSQICYVKTPDALSMDGQVACDLSLTGFGWVAVSFAALNSSAAGRPMERSKVTMRIYGPKRLKVVQNEFPMPVAGLPGYVEPPPEESLADEEDDADYMEESRVLSQPWMKGLGQSVGGMLTAAPGGGTGGDKDEEAAIEVADPVAPQSRLIDSEEDLEREIGLGGDELSEMMAFNRPRRRFFQPEDDPFDFPLGNKDPMYFLKTVVDLDDGTLPMDDFDEEGRYDGPMPELALGGKLPPAVEGDPFGEDWADLPSNVASSFSAPSRQQVQTARRPPSEPRERGKKHFWYGMTREEIKEAKAKGQTSREKQTSPAEGEKSSFMKALEKRDKARPPCGWCWKRGARKEARGRRPEAEANSKGSSRQCWSEATHPAERSPDSPSPGRRKPTPLSEPDDVEEEGASDVPEYPSYPAASPAESGEAPYTSWIPETPEAFGLGGHPLLLQHLLPDDGPTSPSLEMIGGVQTLGEGSHHFSDYADYSGATGPALGMPPTSPPLSFPPPAVLSPQSHASTVPVLQYSPPQMGHQLSPEVHQESVERLSPEIGQPQARWTNQTLPLPPGALPAGALPPGPVRATSPIISEASIGPSDASLGSSVWSNGYQEVDFVGQVNRPHARAKVARCAGDKALKDRWSSVGKTGKLTDAMRLVAAAKVRAAQAGVEKARPFSDELLSMIKGLVKKLKGTGLEADLPMLRVPEKVNNVGILMITGQRGLCGPYNAFVIKKVKARITDLNEQGIVPKLFIVGRKGVQALTTRMQQENHIAETIENYFLSGEVDKVEIAYSRFINLISNEPAIRTLLPLSPTGIEDPEDETFKLTTEDGKLKVEKEKVKAAKAKDIEADVIFDQPPAVLLNSMLPLYLNSQLLSLLFDAQASELSSRMTAMKAATDNAKDLQKKLLLAYNKKRQAAITAEICEISAAANAIESADAKGAAGPGLGVMDNEESVASDFMKELESGDVPDVPVSYDQFGPATRDELPA